MQLEKNISDIERVGRAVGSLLMLGVALKKRGKLGVLLAFAAGDVMSSAVSGYCPLCAILGHSCNCGDDEPCCCGDNGSCCG